MSTRFTLNMERIHGLVKLICSDIALLKPTGLWRSEGQRADILRAIVVFLHATFEDVLRSRSGPKGKKLNFYSGADINKALKQWGLDPTPFKSLYPPLTQMAKRRKRIVHDADLSKKTDSAPGIWMIADDWQLIMWICAVRHFFTYSAPPSITTTSVRVWRMRNSDRQWTELLTSASNSLLWRTRRRSFGWKRYRKYCRH